MRPTEKKESRLRNSSRGCAGSANLGSQRPNQAPRAARDRAGGRVVGPEPSRGSRSRAQGRRGCSRLCSFKNLVSARRSRHRVPKWFEGCTSRESNTLSTTVSAARFSKWSPSGIQAAQKAPRSKRKNLNRTPIPQPPTRERRVRRYRHPRGRGRCPCRRRRCRRRCRACGP